ncbi:MAG: hypothetical protein ACPGQS_12070 [Bradymonadia bacterium]
MTYFKTLAVVLIVATNIAYAGPGHRHFERKESEGETTNTDVISSQKGEREVSDPSPVDPEKDPCEELEEALQEIMPEGQKVYGGVGCHDGEVLICTYPENFVEPGDDPHGTAIVSACISAHEHEHAGQAECDPNGTGVYPPNNDLKCDESESEALDAEIKCYDGKKCPEGEDGKECRELVQSFKDEACGQYQERHGSAHPSC